MDRLRTGEAFSEFRPTAISFSNRDAAGPWGRPDRRPQSALPNQRPAPGATGAEAHIL